MTQLNLPIADLLIKTEGGKNYVFDTLRKQYLLLTPEEYVRQQFTHFLIQHKQFPASLLAHEVGIRLGKVQKRCDTVVYSKQMQPVAIVEYKAPTVKISQEVFDQIARYNMQLQVSWLVVSNGLQHFCCYIDLELGKVSFMKDLPSYPEIIARCSPVK